MGSSADTSADVSAEALAKAEALARVGHKRRKGVASADGPCVAPIGAAGPAGGSV